MSKFPRISAVLVILAMVGCQPTGYRQVSQYSIEQFLSTTSFRGSSFSADESQLLYSSDETGIFNASTVPVGGGPATALTQSSDAAIFSATYFPHDNRVLYHSDQGGNEIWHLYMRDEDGNITDLTPGDEARSLFVDWSHDGAKMYYTSNARDPQYMDVYEMDVASLKGAMIFQNEEGHSLEAISNDGRYLAFFREITSHNSDMYLFDRETKEMSHLSEHSGDINYDPEVFSSDSRYLYYITDEDREFAYLMRLELSTGEREKVLQINWDIRYVYYSHNGKYQVVGINNDARTEVRITEVATGNAVDLPDLPDGDITSVNISTSENLMAFYHSGSTSPADLYVYNFSTEEINRLTRASNPEIDRLDLVESKVIRYKSFDGLVIPAILYKPRQIKRGDEVPALVWVHGGPGGQSRIGYSALIQYLTNHGYVVLAVNNRGSSGYGKTFFGLDDLKHGADDLDDCVWAKNFLEQTGYVDPARIGIIGGSYGGYMTLAALTYRPEEFTVGVDLYGISNWVRTLESIPPWWAAFRESLYRELGDPESDREMLLAKSPLFQPDQIVRPLMVLQGANDPRVLKVESDEIVAAVRANGVPVEYVVFDDEGHGFVKKANRIVAYEGILNFLEIHLAGSAQE